MLGMILKLTPSPFPVFIRIILHLFPFHIVPVTMMGYNMPSDGSLNVREKSRNAICRESALGWEPFAAWSISFERNIVSLFSPLISILLFEPVVLGKWGKRWNILNTVCRSPRTMRLPDHPWRKETLLSWVLGFWVCQGNRYHHGNL